MKTKPLARKLAFVDVETTGSAPDRGRITEIAIITVAWPDPCDGPPEIQHWQSLVNPGIGIPPEIRFLTGIDDAMLNDAPAFDELATEVAERLDDAVFIAHHARFDYSFVKAEMARAGHRFQARTLCTVRLSRALDAQRSPHTLDALILRWQLTCPERHRAMGDAGALWQLLQAFERAYGRGRVDEVARRLISRPNLPAHLNLQSVDAIPAAPGIYFFHGLNAHPLYIGKSRNLRQRIANHFCTDYESARGIRLASETRSIRWQQTPGDFSALLAEIQAIASHRPAHNIALRRQAQACCIGFDEISPRPHFVALSTLVNEQAGGGSELNRLIGPFASRTSARTRLIALGRAHQWCLSTMGLERGHENAPCFARQLGRCAGACVGAETSAGLATRIVADLQSMQMPDWPAARLLVVEQNDALGLSAWHLFDQWGWLVSGADTEALHRWLENGRHKPRAPAQDAIEAGGAPADSNRCNRHVVDLLIRTLGARQISQPASPLRLPDFGSEASWQGRRSGQISLQWCWLERPPDANHGRAANVQEVACNTAPSAA